MHRVLCHTTIPPQTSLTFFQLSGHALTSPSPGPLSIFLSLPRKETLSTSLIPRPPFRHRSSKKLPCNKHSELSVVATRMLHCHWVLVEPAALPRHHEEQALFFFSITLGIYHYLYQLQVYSIEVRHLCNSCSDHPTKLLLPLNL